MAEDMRQRINAAITKRIQANKDAIQANKDAIQADRDAKTRQQEVERMDRHREQRDAASVDAARRRRYQVEREVAQTLDEEARGNLSPEAVQAFRNNVSGGLSEALTIQEIRDAQRQTNAYADQLRDSNNPDYLSDEELFYKTTAPIDRENLPLPPPTYHLNERGEPEAMTAEEIQLMLQLEEQVRTEQMNDGSYFVPELTLTPPAPPPTSPPAQTSLMSDERAKTDIRPSMSATGLAAGPMTSAALKAEMADAFGPKPQAEGLAGGRYRG
jgi:hypothetical protein